jgi:hypothetical protein
MREDQEQKSSGAEDNTCTGKKNRTKFKCFVQALHLVIAAWNPVASNTTVHCFRRAGFNITDHNLNVEYDENDEDSQEVQKPKSSHSQTPKIVTMTLSKHVC